ncbi:MAG: hypothetical protein JWN00_1260 [Actinomycetia bacterium]|nr:hypothetical protein [Actinomycetes bacterium]
MRDQLRVGWPHLFKQSTRKGQVGGGATSDADGDGAHRSGASSSAGGGAAAEAENHGICHHARATAVPSPSTWPPSRTTWFNPTSAGQVGRDTQVGCSRVREPTRGEHDSRTRSDETSGSPASHTIWSSQVTAMASNQIIQDGTPATARRPVSVLRAPNTTRASTGPNSRAVISPMPRPAPVMSTVLPIMFGSADRRAGPGGRHRARVGAAGGYRGPASRPRLAGPRAQDRRGGRPHRRTADRGAEIFLATRASA